jgi:hypothetical protein
VSCLPDGVSTLDYAYLRDSDRAGLMWEWLRRDKAYAAWYVRATAATRGATPVPLRWRLLLAEDPARKATEAAILWRADLDPGALRVSAIPTGSRNPDALPVTILRRWTTLAVGPDGTEHAVVSDGLHHLRLDVKEGTLQAGPVILHFRLEGTRRAAAGLLTLRRLTALCLNRRFAPSLFPPDPRIERWLLLLRVHDAQRSGATQREIAELLFGIERAKVAWGGASDSLRSRVRRLIGEARHLAAGGYRLLMRKP